MPNWKTYESSVRLLSAIVAAHPGLKLNYEAVADKYGEGVTGRAISERIVRMKKEPEWNLSLTSTENVGTPKKSRATPKKGKKNGAAVNGDEEGASDDETDYSPSKKASLNKVKSGRITKAGRGKANGGNSGVNSGANSFNNGYDLVKSENVNGVTSFGDYENSQEMGSGGMGWVDHGEDGTTAQRHYYDDQDNGFEYADDCEV